MAFLRSAQGPARSTGREVSTLSPVFVVRVFLKILALTAIAAALAFGEDPVAALGRRIDKGEIQLPFVAPYGYLPALLEALHVPIESQMAVFSKTSIQSLRIEPANPRILFFNDAVSVGWVRGGFIELAAQDPGNGINYYVLTQRPNERLTRREDCLNCHKSGTTRLSSVIAAPDGVVSRQVEVDNRTPFSARTAVPAVASPQSGGALFTEIQLWGGWFVTGSVVSAGHGGNAVFAGSDRRELVPNLNPAISLTASSDVVALSVFAHQMRMMNLLAHPDNIEDLVDALLFVDEAPWPGPMRGSSGFAEEFSAQGPRDRLDRSLRQFDLQHRLMRYPCSYMIYTDAFDALPAVTKGVIYRRMWRILSGEDTAPRYKRLSSADREAVIGILRDTKRDLPGWFGASQPR